MISQSFSRKDWCFTDFSSSIHPSQEMCLLHSFIYLRKPGACICPGIVGQDPFERYWGLLVSRWYCGSEKRRSLGEKDPIACDVCISEGSPFYSSPHPVTLSDQRVSCAALSTICLCHSLKPEPYKAGTFFFLNNHSPKYLTKADIWWMFNKCLLNEQIWL